MGVSKLSAKVFLKVNYSFKRLELRLLAIVFVTFVCVFECCIWLCMFTQCLQK